MFQKIRFFLKLKNIPELFDDAREGKIMENVDIRYSRCSSNRASFKGIPGLENPSGGYPADIHRMRSAADLIRFLANERRNSKSGPITTKFTREPTIFLHIILCMYYGKIIALICV